MRMFTKVGIAREEIVLYTREQYSKWPVLSFDMPSTRENCFRRNFRAGKLSSRVIIVLYKLLP